MHDHDHDHDHSHDHHHHHSSEETRSEHVVLDLGDGVGALIVYTDPSWVGREIEISPAGRDGEREHKAVLRRTMGEHTAYCLVYDNLAEGEYSLWVDDAQPVRGIAITGGFVSELDLSVFAVA